MKISNDAGLVIGIVFLFACVGVTTVLLNEILDWGLVWQSISLSIELNIH